MPFKTQPLKIDEVRTWLHKEGVAYKNETISLEIGNGQNHTGKLNWQHARQYDWQGQDYVDVPYEFPDYGTTIPGSKGLAPARFNLVVRKKGDNSFEGALRTEALGVQIGGNSTPVKTLQIYRLLNGENGNIWYSNLDYSVPKAAKNETLTEAQFLQRQHNLSTTQPRKLITYCETTQVVTYSGNCNYSIGEMVYVRLCRNVSYVKTCETYDDGSSGGGGGISYPPAPTAPPTTEPSPQPPITDPCAEAAAIANKMNNLLQKLSLIDSILGIPNISTEKNEQGMFLIEKRTYDPYDPTKYTSSYFTTPVQKSQSTDNINIGYTTKANEYIVGFIHTHPSAGSAGPSAGDVLVMAAEGHEYITNAMNPEYSSNYLGNFVAASDGSIYAVAVTDNVMAYNFYTSFNGQIVNGGWKKGTNADKIFNTAYLDYKKAYNGNNNVSNLAYEAAQAKVLNQINAGVSIVKYNPTTGKFEPVIKTVVPKLNANGKVEKDSVGNNLTTVTNPC